MKTWNRRCFLGAFGFAGVALADVHQLFLGVYNDGSAWSKSLRNGYPVETLLKVNPDMTVARFDLLIIVRKPNLVSIQSLLVSAGLEPVFDTTHRDATMNGQPMLTRVRDVEGGLVITINNQSLAVSVAQQLVSAGQLVRVFKPIEQVCRVVPR